MYSARKFTEVTLSTDEINSDIYRILGLEYNSDMYRIRKEDKYHSVEFEFEDVDKAHELYNKWNHKYSSDYFSPEYITNLIHPQVGSFTAVRYEVVIKDELDTLSKIRQLLKADDKYDKDAFKFIFNLIEDGKRARVTIRIKCDILVLF